MPNHSGGTHVPLITGTSKAAKNGIATNQNTIEAPVTSSVVDTMPKGSLASR